MGSWVLAIKENGITNGLKIFLTEIRNRVYSVK